MNGYLGPAVNGQSWNHGAEISPDGSVLYFDSGRSGGFNGENFWQVTFTPILDFNSDGKVDAADMTLLLANWGKSQTLYDIGPLPLGDGVVDEKDLSVLMKEITGSGFVVSPHSDALEVPGVAILSWTAVPLAETYDVYFGPSLEDVQSADRANPRGVLASQGQTGTTYDPEGLLDYGRTYYWRVDFVSDGPAPTIYKGTVLGFTTEAYARPIKNIIAKASSAQAGSGPERTVDGSGLDKSDGHSTNAKDMWWSQNTPPHWIQYEFDTVYTLQELWVWNSNRMVEPFMGFGAKTVKIEYSTDGTTWTPLANVPEFARAPGQSGYVHDTTISFGGASAKYVKLTIEKGWGTTPSVGLSEVRFFYIPDRSAAAKP